MADEISILISAIINKFKTHQLPGAFTVAISGIDAAGRAVYQQQTM